ncbi:MAG: MvdC/MvdD family ATP grasp protein [Nitrosomonas ureae]
MILLITNKDDVTTDFVANRLNKIGELYYRLNSEELLSGVGVNLDIWKDEYALIDRQRNRQLRLADVKSVYYRRPGLPRIGTGSLSPGEANFIDKEIAYTLEGIYKILRDCFWISPVTLIREAENKIYQLRVAREVGFEIPRSLITTSPEEARCFFNDMEGYCVIKPIRSGKIDDPRAPMVVFTSSIADQDISLLDEVRQCPTYFQNRIDKVADIRVTVVGAQVFAAQIYSQENEETMIDWRKGANEILRHERIELPLEIREKCIELVKQLGLRFGAIDLVLCKNMRYVFLEINPNGQWGWIEKRLGYDISGAIVNLLLTGAQGDGNY